MRRVYTWRNTSSPSRQGCYWYNGDPGLRERITFPSIPRKKMAKCIVDELRDHVVPEMTESIGGYCPRSLIDEIY